MPIPVVCPGCKASFNVSDKFAGKQGPCPKCKTAITIPKLDAAKPVEEVKIHAPDETQSGPKGSTGRPVLKPIARKNARLSPVIAGGVGVAIVGLFLFAWLAGDVVKRPYHLAPEELRNASVAAEYHRSIMIAYVIRSVALLVIGLPIVWAGYLILRDDELEPFRGRALWLRVGIVLSVYLGLWLAYAFIPYDSVSAWYVWMIIGIPFFAAGFTVAYFSFEFDPTSAAVHFLSFVTATLMLGATAGLTMPWSDGLQTLPQKFAPTEVEVMALYDSSGRPMNDAARKIEADKEKAAAAAAAATKSAAPK